MKQFGIYIARWIVVLFVLFFLLDALYTWVYTNSIPRNKVSYVLSKKNENIDYIFLGSSRVDNFIDSQIVEGITGKKALNLGVQGAKLDDYYLMLQLLKKQNIRSDVVFVQVDYVYNMTGTSAILKSELMPFISDPLISEYIRERDPDFWKLKYIPFYRYMIYGYKLGFREFISSLIQKKPRVNLDNGYNAKYGSTGSLKSGLPDHIVSNNKVIDSMQVFANKNNIKLVFFTSPFCGNTKNLSYVEKLETKFEDFMNYAEIFSAEDQYFFNCGHVNNKGAAVFSTRIAEDIVLKYQN